MGYRENLYDFVLVLHILAVVIGFGAVFLNGIYGSEARSNQGPVGLGISRAVFKVAGVAQWFIYAVFVLGIILIIISDDVIGFDELWVTLSMTLYIVGMGLSHGLLRPAVKKMLVIQEELVSRGGPPPGAGAAGPPPEVAELEGLGKRVGMTSMVLNLLVVVITFLMVFKPGSDLL